MSLSCEILTHQLNLYSASRAVVRQHLSLDPVLSQTVVLAAAVRTNARHSRIEGGVLS